VSRTDEEFRQRYGPWALVAGASEGIGRAFAEQIAARGVDVALVARRPGPLEEVAARLRETYGVQTRVVSTDLGAADVSDIVRRAVDDLEIGLLVYNAAYSPLDTFVNVELPAKMAVLDVNVRAPVSLCSVFAPAMVERGRGGILLMSSIAGFQGSSQIALYAASKAFDTVFAEGLWCELAPRGVDVLGCIAGATLTPSFMDNTPREKWRGLFPLAPEQVAAEGLAHLGRGPLHVTGRMNRLTFSLFRHAPRRAVVRLLARTSDTLYGREE